MLKQKVPNVQINSLHRYDCMGAPCTFVSAALSTTYRWIAKINASNRRV